MVNSATKINNNIKFESAIRAAFPNKETFQFFIEDNETEAVDSIICCAYENGLINERNHACMKKFIESDSIEPNSNINTDGISFKIFKEKAGIKSTRWLTREINRLIEKCKLKMPKISNVMFTRLTTEPANTIAKRNTLRMLSFWIGFERSELIPFWNYETLLFLSPSQSHFKSNEGVRIAFSLHNRGDVINEKSIKWFKKELINCLKDLKINYANFNGSQSFQITEFSINLPKNSSEMDGYSHPGSYGRCIRDAISISHQISIRWTLSEHNSQKRFLTIGIAAGEFANIDLYLKPIINIELPGNPIIRLTDFAHQCVLINRVRVIFSNLPQQINIFNGEIIFVWWIIGLWNTLYLDFIPKLLSDKILQNNLEANNDLRNLLWFGDEITTKNDKINIIKTFLKFPHNSLLGVEIAKTLYFRRNFWAVNEILEFVLNANPYDLTARTLRMLNFWNMGACSNKYSICEFQFKRARSEAEYIEQNCHSKDEDFYCEYGLINFIHAIIILKLLRKNNGLYKEEELNISLTKKDVYKLLCDAEKIFERAFTVPSTGIRSLYWLLCCKSLKIILQKSEEFFNNNNLIIDKYNVCKQVSRDLLTAIGWFGDDLSLYKEIFQKRTSKIISEYENTVYLRCYKPNVMFSIAILLWDYSPEITYYMSKQIINLLNEIIKTANDLKQDDLSIYSVTGLRLLKIQDFIKQVDRTILEIQKRIGSFNSLSQKNDMDILDDKTLGGLKLFMMNISEY